MYNTMYTIVGLFANFCCAHNLKCLYKNPEKELDTVQRLKVSKVEEALYKTMKTMNDPYTTIVDLDL